MILFRDLKNINSYGIFIRYSCFDLGGNGQP